MCKKTKKGVTTTTTTSSSSSSNGGGYHDGINQSGRMAMTIQGLFITCLCASVFSYYVGHHMRNQLLALKGSNTISSSPEESSFVVPNDNVKKVPPRVSKEEKAEFIWKMTSSEEERVKGKSMGSDERLDGEDNTQEEEEEDDDDDESSSSSSDDDEDDDEDEEHKSMSHHLLMSLSNLKQDLIESEDSIYQLMKHVEDEFDLQMVAHTCQRFPTSTSRSATTADTIRCYGILTDGHISIYVWPTSSIILFDLMTREEIDINDMTLLSNVFKMHKRRQQSKEEEATIAVPIEISNDFVFGLGCSWSIKRRGINEEVADYHIFMSDPSDLKKQIASIQSPFQKIDIVDFQDPRDVLTLHDALQRDPDYVLNNPECFQPDRILFLDGVMQSGREGNAAYHESLVQPAIFAHADPKRVAIIGGGECATLREVLKHNTVEQVIMIDIDEVIVEASKLYLPDWNDCSNIVGSSKYCMDDHRATIFNEDAFKWFIDRFGANPTEKDPPFDVIILDALDPQNVVDFAEALYGDSSFLGSLYNGLTEDGILVSQVGEMVRIFDPAQTHSINRNRALFINRMIDQGFVNIVEYDEAAAQFEAPWTFNVLFKSLVSRHNWDDSEAMVNLKIKKRAVDTVNGKSPFVYFDSADMQRRLPSKPSEVVFCRQQPTPPGCKTGHGFDPMKTNFRRDVLQNRTNNVMNLFDENDEFYVMLEDKVQRISFQHKTDKLLSFAGRHEVFRKSILSRMDSFQKLHSYKTSPVDGSYKIGTDVATYTANMHERRKRADATRSYVYNPAIARNSDLQSSSDTDLLLGQQDIKVEPGGIH